VGHLKQVFQVLYQEQLRVKLAKCSFAKQQIAYHGYAISPTGVSTCPKKVQAMSEWLTQQNVRDLRGFLGLAGYYRKFVENFGVLARPLTDLLKKHVVFHWNQDHDTSFNILKTALIQSSILALLNFSKTFSVETDASDTGVGVVLCMTCFLFLISAIHWEPTLEGYQPMRRNT
jgi:hypothetical protein